MDDLTRTIYDGLTPYLADPYRDPWDTTSQEQR